MGVKKEKGWLLCVCIITSAVVTFKKIILPSYLFTDLCSAILHYSVYIHMKE